MSLDLGRKCLEYYLGGSRSSLGSCFGLNLTPFDFFAMTGPFGVENSSTASHSIQSNSKVLLLMKFSDLAALKDTFPALVLFCQHWVAVVAAARAKFIDEGSNLMC